MAVEVGESGEEAFGEEERGKSRGDQEKELVWNWKSEWEAKNEQQESNFNSQDQRRLRDKDEVKK